MTDVNDGITLDPEAQRAAELEQEAIELNELDRDAKNEVFRVTREILGAESARLSIVRMLPADKHGYVGEMSPGQFTMERLRKLYGPGTYKIRVLGPAGFLPGGGKAIVAPDQEDDLRGPQNFAAMLEELDKRNAQRASEKRDRIIELITALGPTISPVLVALFQRKTPELDVPALIAATRGPSMTDLTQSLAALKSLSPAPEPQADMLDKALKVLDVIESRGGGGGGDGGWTGTIRKLIESMGPSLGAVLEKVATAIPRPGPAAPGHMARPGPVAPGQVAGPTAPNGMFLPPMARQMPPAGPDAGGPQPVGGVVEVTDPESSPASAGASAAPEHVSPVSTQGDAMQLELIKLLPWFKSQTDSLIQRASRDVDPGLAAEIFIADFPDDVNADVILPLLQRPEWFNLFKQFDPRVAQFEPWFTEMYRALLEQIAELQREDQTAPAANAGPQTPPIAPVQS